MVLHVSRALNNHIETIARIGSYRRIGLNPVLRRLRADCLDDHSDGSIQSLQSVLFGWWIWIVKFARPVSDVSGIRDLCPDVVIQIAGQVQNEVTETVSERKWLAPELSVGERRGEFANSCEIGSVTVSQNSDNCATRFRHVLPLRGPGAHVVL